MAEEEKKEVRYDVDGFDAVTEAIRRLVNQFPGLPEGDEVMFSTLEEDSGKAIFPEAGAIIESEKKSITGHVTQICLYPFYVVYRAAGLSEDRKAAVKEWLDTLGRWLERQGVTVNGEEHRLDKYPALTGGRKILSIARQTPGHLDSINENRSENWVVSISARYRNEYETW